MSAVQYACGVGLLLVLAGLFIAGVVVAAIAFVDDVFLGGGR